MLALRISYVGELGWELYAPFEQGLRLWDILWEAGEPHGVIAVGGGAFDSLRLEKGYRLWGQDIHTEHNPYEAGINFAVHMNKGDFIGRDALTEFRAQGNTRQLCCMTLDNPDSVVMGKEPIMDADRFLGYVTSANYGPHHRPRHRLRLSANSNTPKPGNQRRHPLLRRTPPRNGCPRTSLRSTRHKNESLIRGIPPIIDL